MRIFAEEDNLLATNLALAAAQTEQENSRVQRLLATFSKRDGNNKPIKTPDDDPTRLIDLPLLGSTKCQVAIGLGPRSYQQDIYAARVVSKLAELSDDRDVRRALYQTITRLGNSAADFYCGCTLSVVIPRASGNLIAASVGDSRIVAFDQSRLQALSYDHKPNCASERLRIEASGGHIWTLAEARTEMRRQAGKPELSAKMAKRERERYGNALYVNGVLNLTRSIGNSNRLPGKIHNPCLTQDQYTVDTVVVIASDGLWDVVAPGELQKLWQEYERDLKDFADILRKTAFQRGSGDNCCVLVTKPEVNAVYYVADGHGYDADAKQAMNDGIDLVRDQFFTILIEEIETILAEKKTFSTTTTASQTTREAATTKSSPASQTICSQEETDDHKLVREIYRRLSSGSDATPATKKRTHDEDNSSEGFDHSKRSAKGATKFGLSVTKNVSSAADQTITSADTNDTADTSQLRRLSPSF